MEARAQVNLMSLNASELIKRLKELLEDPKVSSLVKQRIAEFEAIGKRSSKRIFSELCFCILTANFTASGGIKIQKALEDEFLTASEEELASRLKQLGHRFPSARAHYIVLGRKYANRLVEILKSFKTEQEAREWLVRNIKGIGYKEASHFLRNIGYKNLAILDFHILDLLARYGIIEKPKTLTRKRYLEIEQRLSEISKELDISLAELDLYLWYLETGKILK